MPNEKDTETAEKVEVVIKTIEEVRLHRREDPKGFRQALRNLALRFGLTWLFSRGK